VAGARPPPPPFDFLSRALAYSQSSSDSGPMDDAAQAETRAFMAALASREGTMSAAAGAGAGGNGGDGDDSDDADLNGNDNASAGGAPPQRDERDLGGNSNAIRRIRRRNDARNDNNDAAGGGAPLRRSMRIRSARIRRIAVPPVAAATFRA
jgi:hypothetical protein